MHARTEEPIQTLSGNALACSTHSISGDHQNTRILAMPYKLNKVLASLTSSSGFMKILVRRKYAETRQTSEHWKPQTSSGIRAVKAEAKVTRTRFTHSWRNNNLNISLQSYFNNLSSLDYGGFEETKNVQPRRVRIWHNAARNATLAYNVGIEIIRLLFVSVKKILFIRSNI